MTLCVNIFSSKINYGFTGVFPVLIFTASGMLAMLPERKNDLVSEIWAFFLRKCFPILTHQQYVHGF